MIKKLIKHIVSLFGYTIAKNYKVITNGSSIVRVGKFNIQINNNNGIKYCYENCKGYGSQLSRLTFLLSTHFPDLQAIDIGANLGDSVALIKTGADIPIISIEGDNNLINLFKANTTQFKKISLIHTFLADNETKIDCVLSKVGHNLTINPAPKSKKTVLTAFTTINSLYSRSLLNDNCKLLKIDTEGFDLKIIRGGDKFLTKVKPVILFEFNRDNLKNIEPDSYSIFSWLFYKSYNIILFYESDGRFMFSSNLKHQHFLKQLYEYIDGKNAKIFYMDIVAFHCCDNKLAREFIKLEESHRILMT